VPAIATLRRDQLRDASQVLARAFDDDPVFRYLYPASRRRRWSCRSFLGAVARDGVPFGEVWVATDAGRVIGAAGWLPDGAYPPSRWRAVRQLVASWPALLTLHTFRDGLRYLTETEKLHPKEPSWYLAVIGIDPERQGEGLGGKLLDVVLDRLDATHVPAYLETSTEGNVAWYRHHGFEVQHEIRPAPNGPPIWTMWREPNGEPTAWQHPESSRESGGR
jgi:ribosomal protein S18 acetylase RimI-like enzyme